MYRSHSRTILDFGFWILDCPSVRSRARVIRTPAVACAPIQNPKSKIQNRRGFNLIELLIALGITAALLTATLVALNASFMAYQNTTEVASTHTVARLTMNRILTMVRMGDEFGPYPVDPLETTVSSDFMEFMTPEGEIMMLEFDEPTESLLVTITDPVSGTSNTYTLLEGVIRQTDGGGDDLAPFTLTYEKGRMLYRATIDLLIKPDDNMSVSIEGDNSDQTIHLVASAMPRTAAYRNE